MLLLPTGSKCSWEGTKEREVGNEGAKRRRADEAVFILSVEHTKIMNDVERGEAACRNENNRNFYMTDMFANKRRVERRREVSQKSKADLPLY